MNTGMVLLLISGKSIMSFGNKIIQNITECITKEWSFARGNIESNDTKKGNKEMCNFIGDARLYHACSNL